MSKSNELENPLLISPEEAINKLTAAEEKGRQLEIKIEGIYNANYDHPVEIKPIKDLRIQFHNWHKYAGSVISEIYLNKEYSKRFDRNPLDEKRFLLTPKKLRQNLIRIYEESNYSYRLRNATPKDLPSIKREILNEIGDIETHWDFEKRYMIADLREAIEEKLKIITDRLAYLLEFGEYQGILIMEIPIVDFPFEIKAIFPKDSIRFDPKTKWNEGTWETVFNKIHQDARTAKMAMFEADRELLREPNRRTIEIYAAYLKKDDFFTIRDKLLALKRRFEDRVKAAFPSDKIEIDPSWYREAPEFDYKEFNLSFEKLKDYAVNLIYIVESLPRYLSNEGASAPKKGNSKASYAERSETRQKYERIKKEIKRLKEQNPKYPYTTIFIMVAKELKTTSSTVRRAYYG
jgi:hypothetical protein